MLQKLDESIGNCHGEIKKADEEIEQIKKWAIEAIQGVYEVPHKFWYEELNLYEDIKKLEENQSVSRQVAEKCDEVTGGYLEEIELRKAKIELYQGLIKKYEASKEKMLMVKKKKDDETMADSKLQALEKHSKRIEQMREEPENLPGHIKETTQLELMKEEIQEVITEYEISEEVRNSMLEINKQFKSADTSFTSKAAIKEIKELLNKISKE